MARRARIESRENPGNDGIQLDCFFIFERNFVLEDSARALGLNTRDEDEPDINLGRIMCVSRWFRSCHTSQVE